MEDDFQAKLNRVLSDPETMAKIMSLAGASGATSPSSQPAGQTSSAASSEPVTENGIGGAAAAAELPFLREQSGDKRVLTLLSSLRPLLREERQDRIDRLTKLMTVASVIGPLLGRK